MDFSTILSSIDFDAIMTKITDFLATIDFQAILDKIIEVVTGLISK